MLNRVHAGITALALASGVSFPATCPAASVHEEPRNAALKYWAAWSYIKADVADKVNAVEWKQIGTETNGVKLPREFHEAAAAVDGTIVNSLVEAANVRECDFGVDLEKGFSALLPHLSHARQGARVLRLDARAKMAAGDANAAARDIGAMYRVSAHVAGDQVLISGLVSVAIAKMANEETRLLIASGRLRPADRDLILEALGAADGSDPFGVKRGVLTERRIGPDWIRSAYTGPDAGARLVAFIGFDGSKADAAEQVAAMDGAALAGETERYAAMFVDLVDAWDAPDAAERLAKIEARIGAGGYGQLARLVAPSLTKAHGADAAARDERARILDQVRDAVAR